jgi:nitroreductase
LELFDAIKQRRSIRSYKSKLIHNTLIQKIIEAGRWAPSAGNCQARDFIIVNDPEVKRGLCKAALNQHFIEEAPVNIVVCANEKRSAQRYGHRGRAFYCFLDAAASVQNILLAIHDLGLGACWIGAFHDRMVVDILNLPPWLKPVAIIPIGYPNENPPTPSRLQVNEIAFFNLFKNNHI